MQARIRSGSLTSIGTRAARKIPDSLEAGLDRADQHVIAARIAVHADDRHCAKRSLSAAMIASTTSPWAPPPLRMWICASA